MYSTSSVSAQRRSREAPSAGGRLHPRSRLTREGRRIADSGGHDALPALSHHPLYGTLGDVLHKGHPTVELGYRIRDMMAGSNRALLMPTFFDHHDIERMIENDSVAALQQGLLLIMTLPGVPVIHYAAEHAFNEYRRATFSPGEATGEAHRFGASAPVERLISQLARLREENAVFSHGTPAIVDESRTGPGAFAYTLTDNQSVALVAINTSDRDCLTRTFATGMSAGTPLESRVAIGGAAAALVVEPDGTVAATMPARGAFVWISRGAP